MTCGGLAVDVDVDGETITVRTRQFDLALNPRDAAALGSQLSLAAHTGRWGDSDV